MFLSGTGGLAPLARGLPLPLAATFPPLAGVLDAALVTALTEVLDAAGLAAAAGLPAAGLAAALGAGAAALAAAGAAAGFFFSAGLAATKEKHTLLTQT